MRLGIRLAEGGDAPLAAVAQAELAEELGYDAAFLGEHHGFATYWPSPQLVLAAIAARTCRILIGTNVLLLPLAQPVRLAGEAALLDRLSEGRLVLGVGLGWLDDEYAALGTDRSRRGADADAALVLLRALWSGEPVDHDGGGIRLRGFRLVPEPRAPDAVPVWVGGRSEAALRRAARFGDAWTADAALTVAELARSFARCDALRAELGRPPAAERPVTRHVVLASTNAEARRAAEAHLRRDYAQHLARGNPMVTQAWTDDLDDLLADRYVVGDADEVGAWVERLAREAGVTHLLVKFPALADASQLREQMAQLRRIVPVMPTDRGAP